MTSQIIFTPLRRKDILKDSARYKNYKCPICDLGFKGRSMVNDGLKKRLMPDEIYRELVSNNFLVKVDFKLFPGTILDHIRHCLKQDDSEYKGLCDSRLRNGTYEIPTESLRELTQNYTHQKSPIINMGNDEYPTYSLDEFKEVTGELLKQIIVADLMSVRRDIYANLQDTSIEKPSDRRLLNIVTCLNHLLGTVDTTNLL